MKSITKTLIGLTICTASFASSVTIAQNIVVPQLSGKYLAAQNTTSGGWVCQLKEMEIFSDRDSVSIIGTPFYVDSKFEDQLVNTQGQEYQTTEDDGDGIEKFENSTFKESFVQSRVVTKNKSFSLSSVRNTYRIEKLNESEIKVSVTNTRLGAAFFTEAPDRDYSCVFKKVN